MRPRPPKSTLFPYPTPVRLVRGPTRPIGGLTSGTHGPVVPLRQTTPNPRVLGRKSHCGTKTARDESRPQTNLRTRLRKKAEHPLEVCPPVPLRARPYHRPAPDRLAGTPRRHPDGDGGGAVARGDEFAALAGRRALGRVAR